MVGLILMGSLLCDAAELLGEAITVRVERDGIRYLSLSENDTLLGCYQAASGEDSYTYFQYDLSSGVSRDIATVKNWPHTIPGSDTEHLAFRQVSPEDGFPYFVCSANGEIRTFPLLPLDILDPGNIVLMRRHQTPRGGLQRPRAPEVVGMCMGKKQHRDIGRGVTETVEVIENNLLGPRYAAVNQVGLFAQYQVGVHKAGEVDASRQMDLKVDLDGMNVRTNLHG